MQSGVMWTVRRCCAGALAAASLLAGQAAMAGPDVGVSISISQPGVYGRVDIGQFPQPRVYVPQPVIIAAPRVRPEPVYMWVAPGHRKHWGKHCARYNACGVPVYFVQDDWYHAHVDRRDERRDDRREGGRGDGGRGHGNGHGRGHGGPH
jgi:hypothetical protein